ncbi:hypothetical protein [Streptacidiphilus sp. EB103A]|uniref:hypothetical protein n=1 Tax=Streptacidiphilus sp. EB103A TaxID=3156275 RepID=UPI003514EBA3
MPSLSNLQLTVAAMATLFGPSGLATPQAGLAFSQITPLGSGTGANQADKMYAATRTLALSAAEDLDLAGTLTDAFGATITFARIKAMIFRASAANTNNVVVGNAAANGFVSWCGAATHTVTVRPGGTFALIAPDVTAYAVTPSTADLLHVLNGGAGTPVTYDVVLIGASV